MSRMAQGATAGPVSRDQILRRDRGKGTIIFPCSADHEQDWQLYSVDPYSAIGDDHTYNPRALSLRNLVSEYECGREFPPGVGPGSPSRDAVNWLPSRFGLSVETRLRYGWLRMVFPGVRPFRAPIWCPSGGWVGTRFGEGGGELDRRRARGELNPCAREI